jgi:hypothetical protein
MKIEGFHINIEDYNLRTKNRFNIVDSYMLKDNLEKTMKSEDSMRLEFLSKLCDSVKIEAS